MRRRVQQADWAVQEKLNEAVVVMNKGLQVSPCSQMLATVRGLIPRSQEINIQNMNVELVAQMFKNYQSNVLFHLEGTSWVPQASRT